jgi:hypothetical protein
VPEQLTKAGIAEADRGKIVRDNAMKTFGLLS